MKRLLILFFLILFHSISYSENFVIKEYNIDISLKKNGEVKVKEEVLINFHNSKEEIIRFLPLTFNDIKGRKRKVFVYDIQVIGERFSVEKDKDFCLIKIANSDRFVNREKKYVINYQVFGSIIEYRDSDFFHFNLVDPEWNALIEKSQFYIFLPKEYLVRQEDIKLCSHKKADREMNVTINIDKGLVYGKKDNPISPEDGLSIIIALPKGLINQSSLTKFSLFIKDNMVFIIPVLAFLILFIVWWFIGKDETITKIIYYKPPKDLNPAIAGYLFNDKADNRDLISLLFYWAHKGIISIEDVDDPLSIIFSKKDYLIKKNKLLPLDSKPFEWIIYNDLFPYQIKSVRVSSLKDKFHTTMELARKELENYISNLNLYQRWSLEIGKILKILFSPTLILGFYFVFIGDIKFAINLIITSVIILFFSFIMPKKSPKGNKLYEILLGFKNFLEKVEKPKFEKMMAKNPEYFNEILPYAIAFGIADKLANKFEGLFSKPPEWLTKSGKTFDSYDFFNDINILIFDINKIFTTTSDRLKDIIDNASKDKI